MVFGWHFFQKTFQIASFGSFLLLFSRHVASFSSSIGSSMSPTFLEKGEKLIVEYISPLWKPYQVGDVIIFLDPTISSISYSCKRIRAKEGEIVVSLEGNLKDKDSVIKTTFVPQGHVWVEGDNPAYSVDSRSYGPIPEQLIVGRVWRTIYPFSKFTKIKHDPNYYEQEPQKTIHSRIINPNKLT